LPTVWSWVVSGQMVTVWRCWFSASRLTITAGRGLALFHHHRGADPVAPEPPGGDADSSRVAMRATLSSVGFI
jgi:hypothetical protein